MDHSERRDRAVMQGCIMMVDQVLNRADGMSRYVQSRAPQAENPDPVYSRG